jgi:6-phosphogluconolactonase (cycloisomerase 2 family)
MHSIVTAALWLSVVLSAAAGAQPIQRVYIGTFTDSSPSHGEVPPTHHGEGIYIAHFDTRTGKLSVPELAAKTPSPSWLVINKARTVLYAINNYNGFADPAARADLPPERRAPGKGVGAVCAFAIDPPTGKLTLINRVSAGDNPTHLAIAPNEQFLLSANYEDGSIAVVPIVAGGGVAPYTDLVRPTGPIHPDKAAENPVTNFFFSSHNHSHVHMVGFDPSGRYILVDDAGLDRVLVFKSTLKEGRLEWVSTFDETPGSAPRHYAFSPDGTTLYNLLEQNSKLSISSFDAETGRLTLRARLSTVPLGFMGSNAPSELLITRDGRHLYAANRINDTIAHFQVDTNGEVRPVAHVHTGGDNPRSLTLDPTGRFLFSMNQSGDAITVFQLDPNTGTPVALNQWVPVGSPTVMLFAN